MKVLLLSLLSVCFLSIEIRAQNDCRLIENTDPTLSKVSYQTVFVTVITGKDKFNIKFWKFTDKFAISCFVVTKDTFCVDPSSTVTFNFSDGNQLSLVSDKKQNCRGELNKDFKEEEMPGENAPLWREKVKSINITGIRSNKTFVVDDKTATLLQNAFRCIIQKKVK